MKYYCYILSKKNSTVLYLGYTSDLARKREKQLKNWHNEWKLNLIKKSNPNLESLIIK